MFEASVQTRAMLSEAKSLQRGGCVHVRTVFTCAKPAFPTPDVINRVWKKVLPNFTFINMCGNLFLAIGIFKKLKKKSDSSH